MTNQEAAIRNLISSMGVLVGLVWEKALDEADLIILEETIPDHLVIGKILLSFFIVIVVFPAWFYYLIPQHQKTWKDHHQKMMWENFSVALSMIQRYNKSDETAELLKTHVKEICSGNNKSSEDEAAWIEGVHQDFDKFRESVEKLTEMLKYRKEVEIPQEREKARKAE